MSRDSRGRRGTSHRAHLRGHGILPEVRLSSQQHIQDGDPPEAQGPRRPALNKSAIEWIMERYAIKMHEKSGITNNPNDWAIEVGNPRYILDLLLSIINVSVQTVDIIEGLPKITF